MKDFKLISPSEMVDNPIELIGKDWMLISAGDTTANNSMTASWGTIGYYSNQPIVTIFVRPERHTFSFVERSTHFTLTVLESELKGVHQIFGKLSGRDCDKVAMSGLTPLFTPKGNPTFEQGRVVLECRKIFSQSMDEGSFIDKECYAKWYGEGHGSDHVMFIGVIEGCWVR